MTDTSCPFSKTTVSSFVTRDYDILSHRLLTRFILPDVNSFLGNRHQIQSENGWLLL